MFILSLFLQNNRKIFIPLTTIILISICFQAWLGKLVVDSNLAPYKISTHLLMAIIIVLLVYNIIKTDEIKKLIFFNCAIIVMLIQISLGISVRNLLTIKLILLASKKRFLAQ